MKKLLFILAIFAAFSCVKKIEESKMTTKAVILSFPVYLGKQDTLVPLDNPITEEGVALGRKLFYEKMLSSDLSISCGSCHIQKFGFTDNKQFSEGVGKKIGSRHAMPIVNTMWQNRFFWDGRALSLEDQALKPIENTQEMNLPIDEAVARLQGNPTYPELFKKAFGTSLITKELLAKALSQFERTLLSFSSKFDKARKGEVNLTDEEKLGETLFFTHPDPNSNLRGANCADCHSGILSTSQAFFNNGSDPNNNDIGLSEHTKSENDLGKFKVPSLRNVALRERFMHDGRFSNLEEVINHYNSEDLFSHPNIDGQIKLASNNLNGKSLGLTDEEKKALIAFLHTLTDESFLTNPSFSDPFQ